MVTNKVVESVRFTKNKSRARSRRHTGEWIGGDDQLITMFFSFVCLRRRSTSTTRVFDLQPLLNEQEAFDILGFTKVEKSEVYYVTASVMHLGELKFKQRGREEQAEQEGTVVRFILSLLLAYSLISKKFRSIRSNFQSVTRVVDAFVNLIADDFSV